MTVYTSGMISGMVGQQLGMFQGYGGYAAGFGPGAMYGGMGQSPYRAPPPPTSFMTTGPGQHGMYGEQTAMRLANFGRTAGAIGGVGLSTVGMMAGIPMDPLSGALMGGLSGGVGGALGGAAMGGAIGLGIYGATKAVGAYANAFTGGINDQAVTNSVLRNNFNFYGGGGAFGRGFGQGQMGQIGGMLAGEVSRSRGVTNMGELNSLVSMGADAGMFTGTRDVQSFTQNFRKMLDTLKNVQRELGGTLTEALSFVRSSQQAGIFQNADRVNFAAEIRTAEAVSGMDRNQLVALAAQGSQISRAYGGLGRQGAMGAVRVAQTLGTAVQSGAINQEMLSEATGGLTGADALSAFTSNMLSRSGAFSRRSMGRYSLFAMSNEQGTGLDEDMVDRFRSGDLSVSEVSRAAHRNVGRMGRARAINREGRLRGAIMEEGGLSAQIGMMRLMVGDRVMDAGDDLSQLVLQRRFGMGRAEAGVMTSLIRNQGTIAEQENIARISSAREVASRTDIEQNRSFEAFTRSIEHGMSDATGLTAARELGRRFATRMSDAFERAGNNFLGITAEHMTAGDRSALARLSVGRASNSDLRRLTLASGGGMFEGRGGTGSLSQGFGYGLAESYSRRSLGDSLLHTMGFHTRESVSDILRHEGVNLGPREVRGKTGDVAGYTAGMSDLRVREELRLSELARAGIPMGESRQAFESLMGDKASTVRAIAQARLAGGQENAQLSFLPKNMDRRAALAFMATQRYTMPERANTASQVGGGGVLEGLREGFQGGGDLYTRSLEFVRHGGHLGQRLNEEMRAEDAAIGRRSQADIDYSEGPGGARGNRSGRRARRTVRERNSEAYFEKAAIRDRIGAASMSEGLDREALESVVGSEDFAARVATMTNLTGMKGALHEQITAGRESAMRMQDQKQQQVALALYAQMEENVNKYGDIGSEARHLVRGPNAKEREQAILRQVGQTTGTFRAFESALGGVAGPAGERLRAAAGGVGQIGAEMIGGNVSLENYDTMRQRIRQFTTELAHVDRSSPEGERAYREMMNKMRSSVAGDESGQGIMSQISMGAQRRSQLERDLSGRGRRGRQQVIETIMSEATGGTFGSMNFNVTDARGKETTVSGTRAMRMLQQGGGLANQILEQLETNLQTSGGVDASGEAVDTGTVRQRITSALEATRGNRGGGLTQEQMTQLIGGKDASGRDVVGVGDITGMDRVRAQAASDSLESARASSPLDAERNKLLTDIKESINARMADTSTRKAEAAENARLIGVAVGKATSLFGGDDDPPDRPVPPGGNAA